MNQPNAAAVSPCDWHYRPKEFMGTCPICGFPKVANNYQRRQHRAVAEDEGLDAIWIERIKGPHGYRNVAFGSRRPVAEALPVPVPKRPKKVNALTLKRIGRAAHLLAHGKSVKEVAAELTVAVDTIGDWKAKYPELWEQAAAAAAEQIAEVIRTAVGAGRVLDDPDLHVRTAAFANRAESPRPGTFPQRRCAQTLTKFFEEHYRPKILFDAAEETVRDYRTTLRRWELLTGSPPLNLITSDTMGRFRDALLKMRGQRVGTLMSVNSVRSKLRNLNALLAKAGPPGPRNRDAMGFIEQVPWARPPREQLGIPRTIGQSLLDDVYTAAICMEIPQVAGTPTCRLVARGDRSHREHGDQAQDLAFPENGRR